jgi:hypothetical protein
LIKDNIFRHAQAGEGWGISAENLTKSKIENNLWYGDNQTWATVEGAPGTCININNANNVNITGNTAYNVKYAWLTFRAQYPTYYGDYIWESSRNGTITAVRVTNNTVYWSGRAVNFQPGRVNLDIWKNAANLTIGSDVYIGPSNKFYSNGDEVFIDGNLTIDSQLGCVFGAENLKVNNNDLYNSAAVSWWGSTKGFGVWCNQAGPVNATYNWWGHSSGPSGYGNGYGDMVSTNVTYDPWLSAAYPSTTAFAGIWLKPTRASAGSTIEVFSSNLDFTPNETVRTYFEAVLVNTTTAAANGSLYATFTVPSLSAGAYTVTSVGATSSYSATFTIPTLSITLTPTSGLPGITVSVTGEGFTRLGLVRIYLDDAYMNSTSGDAYGNITKTFTLPTTTLSGAHTVKANDASTTNNATQTFTVPTPTLTALTPALGPPKTVVTVSGGNFTIGGAVGIYFDSTFAKNMTADANGNISDTCTVPSLVPATYAVKGKDWSTGTWTSAKSFTVSTPNVTLTPTWGPPGTPVTVSGGNFTIDNGVKIYFDSTSVTNATTNNTGGINALNTFNVPAVVPDTYNVRVMDNFTTYNVTKTFIVPTPTITLSPDGGPPSTEVTVSGGNFTISQVNGVRVYFDSTSVVNATTNATGGIDPAVTFTVPATATIGFHTVRAFDVATTYNATATFNVGPTLQDPIPNSGPPATNVTITGSGFTENQTVLIYFDTTLVKTVNASSTGTLNTWFLIPDAIAGSHNITGYDVNTTTWTPAKTFTIPAPIITLDPTTGQVGQSVTITGTNNTFKLNGTITLWFAGTQWGSTFTANSTGGFSVTRTVPSELPANVTVIASDTVNNATAYYNLYGTGGIDTVQAMLQEIEAKLDEHGSFYNFTNTWFTAISNKLGTFTDTDTVASLLYDIKSTVSAMNLTDIVIIKSYVIDIEAKLDNTTYGLAAIKNAVDAIKLETDAINWTDITMIKGYVDDINWTDITTIKTYVIDIEAKLDNSTYGLSAIKTAVDAINFTAISNKLGTFTGTDTVASLLYDIKTSVQNITATVDFTPVLNAISGLDAKLGTFTGTDTVASLLYDIKASVSAINMEQFHAGTYTTTAPTLTNPVNLTKSSKVTLTVRATDDATTGFKVNVYIYDGTAWQLLSFNVPGSAHVDSSATVEFTTGTDGKFYFTVTGATFKAFIYSAESAP